MKQFCMQYFHARVGKFRSSIFILLSLLISIASTTLVYADAYPAVSLWHKSTNSSPTYSTDTQACISQSWGSYYAYSRTVPTTPTQSDCYGIYIPSGTEYNVYTVVLSGYCLSGGNLSGDTCINAPACTPPNVRQTDGSCAALSKTVCSSTQVRYSSSVCDSYIPPKNYNELSCPIVRNPIGPGIAAKYQPQPIYLNNGVLPLEFALSYLSNNTSSTYAPSFNQGSLWVNTYDLSLDPDQTSSSMTAPASVYATRPHGQLIAYRLSGSVYSADADISDTLSRLTDGYGNTSGWKNINSSDDSVETYNANGRLISIATRSGLTLTVSRDYQGKITGISDGLGRTVSYTYDSATPKPHIIKITQPDSKTTQFSYDLNNNLSTITWPDTKVRQYVYENSSLPNSVTGMIDENANRYATWSYDTQGRAVSTEHAGSTEKSTLSYTIGGSGYPSSTVVTDTGTGAVRTYNFSAILGVQKYTSQSQPSGAGCSAASSSVTYDANSNISSQTDFNGNMTTYVFNLTRNLETSRTEGLTSAGAVIPGTTRTITTTWHATWHLPLQISEYTGGANSSGVPISTTPVKQTTYTYDSRGNLSSRAETDTALGITRTTTITNTYSTTLTSLITKKVIDGPRTDISDITTLNFYDANDTCVGCRGQLKTLTDPSGLITQFTSYDLNSNLLTMTDPNGLVTTNIYDARQRLTSRTVGTLTTSLIYDFVGQVTKLTLPDSSNLNYTYDAAHRLTQIQDGLGNKVVYTLDSEGNRVAENTYDPSGTLAKMLSRSYDQLNRLQTLTGIPQ